MDPCSKPDTKPVSAEPLSRVHSLEPHVCRAETNPLRMRCVPLTVQCALPSQIAHPIRGTGKMTVQSDKGVEDTSADPEDKWHQRAEQLKVVC